MCTHNTHTYVKYRNRHIYWIYALTRKYINIYILSLNIYTHYIYTYFIYTYSCCRNDWLGLSCGDRACGFLAEGYRPFHFSVYQVLNVDLLLGLKMQIKYFVVNKKGQNPQRNRVITHILLLYSDTFSTAFPL